MAEARPSVALVADTHGHLDPRVAEIAARCDRVVHAGDIGAGAVLRTLAAGGAEVLAVAGNADTDRHWPTDDREGLVDLPASAVLDLPGGRLVITHGHDLRAQGRHARLRSRHPDAAAIIYGHSHRAVIDTACVPWILNPGAAGRTRTYGGPACLLLEAGEAGWTLHPYRFPLHAGSALGGPGAGSLR